MSERERIDTLRHVRDSEVTEISATAAASGMSAAAP